MGKLLKFTPRPKSDYQKQEEATGTDNFISLWFNEKGEVNYIVGDGMTIEQMTFAQKFFEILILDRFKNEISYKADEE